MRPRRTTIHALAALVALAGVGGLDATSRVRLAPRPSAASRALDTPIVDHVQGGGPDGGAVSSLVVTGTTPATAFAALKNGGVFKSSDRGVTWVPADYGLPGEAWCELVAVPTESATVYATCDEGLFKTTNGGTRWRQLDVDNARLPLVAPSDPRVVYQPLVDGVVRSPDGGRRWEHVPTTDPKRCGPAGLAIDPADPLVLLCGDEGWIDVSRDGGLSWTSPVKGPDPDLGITALAIDPSDRNTILARTWSGDLYRTTSGGSNWRQVWDSPDSSGTAMVDLLQFMSPSGDVVFARRHSSVLYSLDGGEHWQSLPSAWPEKRFGIALAVDASDPLTVYVGTDAGVMVSTDFGDHWTLRNRGITRATSRLVLHEGRSSTLYATTGSGTFESRDGGDSWTAFRPTGPLVDVAIESLESDGEFGVLARTPAGMLALRRGQSIWTRLALPSGSDAVPRTPLLRSTTNGFTFSDDGGRRWRTGRLPDDQPAEAFAVAAGDTRTVYVSTPGPLGGILGESRIWRTRDNGETWRIADELANRIIGGCCGLLADPNDPNTVYVIVNRVGIGGDGDLVRRTTDGGLTWTEISIPGLVYSLTVLPTAPSTLLAQVADITGAGRFALVTSRDRGDHWTRVGAGLPSSTQISNIVAEPLQPARLYAATQGWGIYRSADGGVTWTPTGPVR